MSNYTLLGTGLPACEKSIQLVDILVKLFFFHNFLSFSSLIYQKELTIIFIID